MDQANVKLGVFEETKVVDGIHTRESAGYRVIVANTPIQHQAGVAVLLHRLSRFQVEEHQFHEPNASSFNLDLGGQKWFVVGCYLVPEYASTIERVVAAISQFPHGATLMVEGDFNTEPAEP